MAASVRDVADRAGVSVGTVSNVLNRPERVAPTTVKRVTTAIADLGFVRNDAARQLRAGHSRSIGLSVLDIGNPFFTDIARGAEDRAREAGLSVLLANSDEDSSRESEHLDLFAEQRVFGILLTPVGARPERLESLRRQGTPTVLVDRQTDSDDFSSVAVDDVAGGYMAVKHLLDIGRRRIVFVGGPARIRQVADRLEGAQKAVADVSDATLDVVLQDSLSVLQGRAAGERLSSRPALNRPDAVFAANDLLAMGLLQAFAMLGSIRVPDDVALIGYDDIDFTRASVVPLSSIRQPSHEIGHSAVDLLVRENDGASDFAHEQIVFQPELVVRESTHRES
ncbi:LacI family DNA-binding transcriptional regulator [Paramicrobacterium chengjingii]|uniref:LacI family DNA-binding transcriptional regulator n=1 Tax=Paramicrobacterium chengjingii TaxID=2769067 RepID=A0ABX6YKQ6_9MICO|nr:LacI family DNA-binding transcriptional regulator [Microbacterium chengjingii]QPZ38925.1 LacI family DNA-binding transcriptional regulator [Microbacterium chengjingii]